MAEANFFAEQYIRVNVPTRDGVQHMMGEITLSEAYRLMQSLQRELDEAGYPDDEALGYR